MRSRLLGIHSINLQILQRWAEYTMEAELPSRSAASRDLLQWAVGLQQQWRRRLFLLTAEVAV